MNRKIEATEPPEGIEKLSTELLIEVFNYVSPQDRMTCSLVSERWYQIARAAPFHGILQITSNNDKATIPRLFKGRDFPFKKIIFKPNVSFLWRKEWAAFWEIVKPHIREIELSNCDICILQKVLPVLPRLEKLTLKKQEIKLPDSSMDSVVLKSLRELDVSCATISNAVLVYLVNCCPALDLLNIRTKTFEQRSGAEIFKTLRDLYWVPIITFHDFDAVLFKDQFSDLNSLSNVEFDGMVIENAGIGNHLGLFADFQYRLDYIKFNGCSLSPMKEQLFKFLVGMDCVESITLANCNINLNSTFDCFSQVKGLKSLTLYEEVNFDSNSKTSKYIFNELEYLTINLVTYDQYAMNKLRLVCPKLRYLKMPKFNLGFAFAFPLLEKLTIYFMYEISYGDICTLRSLERLTHLAIHGLSKLESCDWEFFVFKALKYFEIRGSFKIKVQNILDLIERNPMITEIYIGAENLGGVSEETLKIAFEPIWSVTWIGKTYDINEFYNETFKLIRTD